MVLRWEDSNWEPRQRLMGRNERPGEGGWAPRSQGHHEHRTAVKCWAWGGVSIFFFLLFLGPNLWHMEFPRLGVQSETQLPAYTTATATPNQSHVCHLHRSPRQCWILNLLSEARDRTHNLMVPSQIRYPRSHDGNSLVCFLFERSPRRFGYAFSIARHRLDYGKSFPILKC